MFTFWSHYFVFLAGLSTTNAELEPKILVCQANSASCRNARETSTLNLHKDHVYTRDHHGNMRRANTLHIVSNKFSKTCKYRNGKYHCNTAALKKTANCKKTKQGMVCISGTDDQDHNHSVQVRCWKVSGDHVTCSSDRICAFSAQLHRTLCFNKDQVKGNTCVGKHCYKIDDLISVSHHVVCQTKDVSSCKLVISSFCVRDGKCYSNKSGRAELQSRREKLCARLVVTQAIAARVSVHCQKHPKDIRCRIKVQANNLGRQTEKQIEQKCQVPKNVHQCRVTAIAVSNCRAEVDKCHGLSDPADQRHCYREIYATCITKLHLSQHYCQGKSMDPVISKSCLAVEKQEIRCYVLFQHCKRAVTPAEKRTCEKDAELKCALLSMQYVECFYHKPGQHVITGTKPSTHQVTGTRRAHKRSNVITNGSMCGVLVSALSYCQRSVRKCNDLDGSAEREMCFKEIRTPCATIFRLHQQGKFSCSDAGKRDARIAVNENATCRVLLVETAGCLDHMDNCRLVKGKTGRMFCDKRLASCRGVVKRYRKNQSRCFGY